MTGVSMSRATSKGLLPPTQLLAGRDAARKLRQVLVVPRPSRSDRALRLGQPFLGDLKPCCKPL